MPEFYVMIFYMIIAGKIIKIPEFLRYLCEKLTKFRNFTRFLAEKMPEFYIIIARKKFFLNFGGTCPPPVSYAYDVCKSQDPLWSRSVGNACRLPIDAPLVLHLLICCIVRLELWLLVHWSNHKIHCGQGLLGTRATYPQMHHWFYVCSFAV